MTTITFDTPKLVEKLKSAGFQEDQAEAVVLVITDALDELVTKPHLDRTLENMQAPLHYDLTVLKWMVGALLAGMALLVMKIFF